MSKATLYTVEQQALRKMMALIEDRVQTQAQCENTFRKETEDAQKEIQRIRKQIQRNRDEELETVYASYQTSVHRVAEQFDTKKADADRERAMTEQHVKSECREQEDKYQTALNDALWTADSLFEAGEKNAKLQHDLGMRKAEAYRQRIGDSWTRCNELLNRVFLTVQDLDPMQSVIWQGEPAEALEETFTQADECLKRIEQARLQKIASPNGYVIIAVILALLSSVFIVLLDQWIFGLFLTLGITLIGTGTSILVLRSAARGHAKKLGEQFGSHMGAVEEQLALFVEATEKDFHSEMAAVNQRRDKEKEEAQSKYLPLLRKIQKRRTTEINAAVEKHQKTCIYLEEWRAETIQQAEERRATSSKEINQKYDRELQEAESAFSKRTRSAEIEKGRVAYELKTRWTDGMLEVRHSFRDLLLTAKSRFPDWEQDVWNDPPKVDTIPAGIRFGKLNVDLKQIPNGLSPDPELKAPLPSQVYLPAFLPFPERCPLVFKVKDDGKNAAIRTQQAIMMRFLTGLPPGKVRFTIIDPVGLGDNFAAFMHLADYDEQLVGARIWTEPQQIDKKLTDITAHMENVIQKYLRNQYKSIEDYNEQAGEVAEPYRVLVVANFPTNFNTDAAKRLVSIVSSGSTCGVYSLISVDTKAPLPQGFNLADLEQPSITLLWKDNGFIWKDPDLGRFPLTVDSPPPSEQLTRLIRVIGERSRDANKVEVPFEFVAPTPEQIWTGDTRKSISIAIGRAGATKRQYMQLGVGTAQHALIAGKTGSGKSTFLHALITNLALQYSPEEIELYLIDFKKGVEFKTYATLGLPHAKVIAIESEREFGLSVLQRLDAELKLRGDKFRDVGANDVLSYREYLDTHKEGNGPLTPMPRILLIVDEFQEFFVEDDKLAQECSLLLDRLVRQGRAFGLHVLLGSQTLGGAYTLARATIDQMAVRIALQCSDADAQLILSKDNMAARLLSRPGEAIYNDANGLLEGNDVFQVVWLPEGSREHYLEVIRSKVKKSYPAPLIFEGNIPSILGKNPQLDRLIQADQWPETPRVALAWLGEAIAIKEPTAGTFRPQSGNNLLMIGQQEEAALGIFTSSIISLAAQLPPQGVGFYLLDGTNEEDNNWGYLRRITSHLPHTTHHVERADIPKVFTDLSEELTRRQKGESDNRTPRFIFLHGLHRYRDLRKNEDDFGYRRGDKTASPAEMFINLIREGPAMGIYFLMWCDTIPNLNRSLDRQAMRECTQKILFQMGANDSSTLIDTPAASRLGRNRALYVTEDTPVPEKFRPYGLPSDDWLKDLRSQLEKRRTLTPQEPQS